MSQDKLTPEQVFTPSRAPLKATNVYVNREDAEAELDSAVGQGDVPVIFGEFGVGKTSLALWYFRTAAAEGRLVHYTNPSGKSLDDVFKQALEHLGYAVTVSNHRATESGVSGGISGGIFGTIVAKVTASTKSTSSETTELVIKSPTDAGVLKALEESQIVILIDELHQASQEFRQDLTRLIKSLSDRNADFPVLIVAGTSSQPERLVELDKGVDRLIREVPIRPLTTPESTAVVDRGFSKLELHLTDDLRTRIVDTAAGAPSLLHTICLESAKHALAEGRDHLADDDADHAIQIVVRRHYHRLTERYMKATNTLGAKRYRARILEAAAESESDMVTMEYLVETVSTAVGEVVPRTALSGPLRQLKSAEYGEILADVTRIDGEGRHHNLTVFSDPQMKAYVRFLLGLDRQGNLKHE